MVIGNKDPVVAAATRNGTGKLSEDSPVDEAKADGFVEQEWNLFITGDSLSGEGERVNFMGKYVVKYSNGSLHEHVNHFFDDPEGRNDYGVLSLDERVQ